MNEKRADSNDTARRKLTKESEKINIESLFGDNIGLKNVPIKVTMIYAILGVLWIVFSDGALNMFIENRDLVARIQTIKGWAFVLVSSFLIYLLVSGFTKRSKTWSKKLRENYVEIQATYQQLIAADEEIREKYEELHEKQVIIEKSEERYKLALEGANDAIWEVDLITKDFFSSDKFNDITGYDVEAIKYHCKRR